MEPGKEKSILDLYMLSASDKNFDQDLFQENLVNLDKLLERQKQEIDRMSAEDFKIHLLPLARVKKIMKSDEDVRMISAETPAVFAKACELFILEITHRS